MSESSGPIILENRVDLYVPSQCICGRVIPDEVREPVLTNVKSKFVEWFGRQSELTIKGDWPLPDGSRAKEEVADIYSFCTAAALEKHGPEVDHLAVEVANRLTQDRVLRVFDNLKVALWPNTVMGLKKGRNCSCKGVAGIGSLAPVASVGIKDADWLSKMLYIRGVLSSPKFSVDHARKLFCDALNYRYASGNLPAVGWPDSLRELAVGAPTLLADQNCFKIVHLHLAADGLRRSAERQIIQRICKDDPTFRGLFVVSDREGRSWEFINIRSHGDDAKRLGLRRMRVGIEAVRTATERLATVEIAASEEASITAEAIQSRHDKAFDVEAVTKEFFTEVANWYFWALRHTHFPEHAPKEQDGHDHVSVIRMITRLVFCWFVKEKGLIPADLFDERKLADLLPGFAPEKVSNKDSVFYRAILQNLFFATLNTEMDKRGWAKDEQNFMAHSLYRYKDLFGKPGEALKVFKNIPFLNGGLFECLDKDLGEGKRPRYIRIDGFSRRPDSQPVVPDFLFFGGERELDLSEDYGDRAFRKVKVRGLMHIMNHYRFTVEESTPLEEEVALDPELAGKIFENLLAAYNPETGTTARKQSGSFYTPREIVNYMVDEALIAYLKGKLEKADPQVPDVEPRLRHLFSYEDEGHRFTPKEVELLIAGIDQLKALDPAVGSGAFPMGILHKLVFILGCLDPRNEKWKERQKQRLREAMAAAERIEDGTVRERTLRELEQQVAGVEEAFEKNALDYGRKLYLIENCLYGVDIQPIAVQIAKMRFFISLIADQKVDPDAENLGVRPLPNLETKLVAANTLIAIEKPAQMLLRNPKIDVLEAELRRVRERFFMARTPSTKSRCREQDKKLRGEIAELLKRDGWDSAIAKQLSAWDPYDQNVSAGFFDPEWMFGLNSGFHIVLGNPPYVFGGNKGISKEDKACYKGQYESGSKKINLFAIFIERGSQLLQPKGILNYILPNTLLRVTSYAITRQFIVERLEVQEIVDLDVGVFDGVTASTVLIMLCNSLPSLQTVVRIKRGCADTMPSSIMQDDWKKKGFVFDIFSSSRDRDLLQKLSLGCSPLVELCSHLRFGVVISGNISDVVGCKKLNSHWKPFLEGDEIGQFYTRYTGRYLLYEKDLLHRSRTPDVFETKKVMIQRITGGETPLKATLDEECFYNKESILNLILSSAEVSYEYILGLLNSRLINWYYKRRFTNASKLTVNLSKEYVGQIPVKKIDKRGQEAIAKIVRRILGAKRTTREVDSADDESRLNALVYEAYGLTEEQKLLVEEIRLP